MPDAQPPAKTAGGLTEKAWMTPPEDRDGSLAAMLSIADWRSFVPEAIAATVLAALADTALGVEASARGMPHPSLLAVVLMACQHGVMGGLFAAVLATAAYATFEAPAAGGEDFYERAATMAAQPCAWFALALLVGGLRSLHRHHHAQAMAELARQREMSADLAAGLDAAMAEVERLERRLSTAAANPQDHRRSICRPNAS